jgi:aminobenzoyl-glutamate utilization protein B
VLAVCVSASLPPGAHGRELTGDKAAAVKSVDTHRPALVDLSDQIWRFAETALKETRSSAVLADYAEAQGFRVTRGVAELPTAFVAEFGEGRPIIGVLGEYDALPGLSQKALPRREALEAGAPGHGCGHNLFGPASLGAAIAIKERIAAGTLEGTIRFYGTPAEESVGGKAYMARAGLFRDVDVALAWHPDSETRADTRSSQAIVDMAIEFRGRAAHAAFDPWNGRSALDGVELFTHGVNLLREHVKPTVRMHYVVPDGGDVPNVVPEHARVWFWARDSKRTGVDDVLARVRRIAEGAAIAAGVEASVKVQGGSYEILVNRAGARLLHANMQALGPIEYSAEEQEFARNLQTSAGVEPRGAIGAVKPLDEDPGEPDGGSTDVGDVSWVVPTLHVSVATAPAGVPWHAWPVVAAGGMSIGHKGLTYAAKVLAATMYDLFQDAARREAIRAEFAEQTRGQTYRPFVPDGPPPIPKQ